MRSPVHILSFQDELILFTKAGHHIVYALIKPEVLIAFPKGKADESCPVIQFKY
jgi:hypothetical protein